MIYSNFEKEVIKEIFKIRKKGTEIKFKELLEDLFDKFFNNIGIEITSNKITIIFYSMTTTDYINLKKDEIYEFILLFSKLKNEFDFFIPHSNQEKYEKFSYNFYNFKDSNKIIIELANKEPLEIILNNILSSYFFSSNLREQKNRKFKSIEKINLNITKIALILTAFFSFVSIFIDAYDVFFKKETNVRIINYDKLKNEIIINLN